MLTGDSPLTACHVAKELKISPNKQLILTQVEQDSNEWVWQKVGGDLAFPLDDWQQLRNQYDLCLTGDVSIRNPDYSSRPPYPCRQSLLPPSFLPHPSFSSPSPSTPFFPLFPSPLPSFPSPPPFILSLPFLAPPTLPSLPSSSSLLPSLPLFNSIPSFLLCPLPSPFPGSDSPDEFWWRQAVLPGPTKCQGLC